MIAKFVFVACIAALAGSSVNAQCVDVAMANDGLQAAVLNKCNIEIDQLVAVVVDKVLGKPLPPNIDSSECKEKLDELINNSLNKAKTVAEPAPVVAEKVTEVSTDDVASNMNLKEKLAMFAQANDGKVDPMIGLRATGLQDGYNSDAMIHPSNYRRNFNYAEENGTNGLLVGKQPPRVSSVPGSQVKTSFGKGQAYNLPRVQTSNNPNLKGGLAKLGEPEGVKRLYDYPMNSPRQVSALSGGLAPTREQYVTHHYSPQIPRTELPVSDAAGAEQGSVPVLPRGPYQPHATRHSIP